MSFFSNAMDSTLYSYMELVAGNGCILTGEQRTALQTSLVSLKKNYKFRRVLFWGRILGLEHDYFIAQGRRENEMRDKKYLYSFNCMDWFLLPDVSDSLIEEVSKATKGPFTGDPSFVYGSSEELDAAEEEEGATKVSEENRLAVTIHRIDEEVSVVPRGASLKRPNGLVQINRCFDGLTESEARRLENFMHFREPRSLKQKSFQATGGWSPAIDFMDVVSDDIPKGSWSLQFEGAGKVCVLRNLLWRGLTFYHVPMTSLHGYIYIGDGMKNMDLPFML